MKMVMTLDMATFVGLIEESLHYLKSSDSRVVLPEVDILNKGLNKQAIKNCLKYLAENDIAQNEIKYASEITQSKDGIGFATHTSVRTREYNQVEYILYVNMQKIIPLLKHARKYISEQKSVSGDNQSNRLIKKDARGNYFYDGQEIEINKEAIYFKAFDILFSNADQDGFLSYADIEKELVVRNVSSAKDNASRNKRINNALKNEQSGLFRFAKLNGNQLNNRTLDGRPIIKIIRGEGVQFNNPVL